MITSRPQLAPAQTTRQEKYQCLQGPRHFVQLVSSSLPLTLTLYTLRVCFYPICSSCTLPKVQSVCGGKKGALCVFKERLQVPSLFAFSLTLLCSTCVCCLPAHLPSHRHNITRKNEVYVIDSEFHSQSEQRVAEDRRRRQHQGEIVCGSKESLCVSAAESRGKP